MIGAELIKIIEKYGKEREICIKTGKKVKDSIVVTTDITIEELSDGTLLIEEE